MSTQHGRNNRRPALHGHGADFNAFLLADITGNQLVEHYGGRIAQRPVFPFGPGDKLLHAFPRLVRQAEEAFLIHSGHAQQTEVRQAVTGFGGQRVQSKSGADGAYNGVTISGPGQGVTDGQRASAASLVHYDHGLPQFLFQLQPHGTGDDVARAPGGESDHDGDGPIGERG